MAEKLDEAMLKSVTETLENLAFMEVFAASKEDPAPSGENMSAALLFLEPFQGEIRSEFSRALLEEISETVCGLSQEGCAESALKDILGEILNTIAGRFLTELLPQTQPFRIGLPEPDPLPHPEPELLRTWHFRSDQHPFTVQLSKLFSFDLLPTDKT